MLGPAVLSLGLVGVREIGSTRPDCILGSGTNISRYGACHPV